MAQEDLEIRDDVIKLGQLLKLSGVVDDGAAAREAVASGNIRVNGDVETRRGRQVRPGDVVSVGTEHTFRVVTSSHG